MAAQLNDQNARVTRVCNQYGRRVDVKKLGKEIKIIAALVSTLFMQGRRIADLEAVAAPALKARKEVAEKWSAEIQIEQQAKLANASKIGEGKEKTSTSSPAAFQMSF
jgi:hypothetical protein